MSISLYFGLPGAGKTTILAKLALDAMRKGKYQNIYTNVQMCVPGVTIIQNDDIGKYQLANCLLLIDEATLFADSRAYKTFDKGKLEFFLLHRHYNVDIVLFTQQWDAVDRKIRTITDRVYYVYKGFWTRKWISSYYRIPYGIIIPDPRKTGDKLGEIVQGYSKPPWYIRIFAVRVWRPKYYRYFDSWEAKELTALPEGRDTIPVVDTPKTTFRRFWRSIRNFQKSHRKRMRRAKRGERKILFP